MKDLFALGIISVALATGIGLATTATPKPEEGYVFTPSEVVPAEKENKVREAEVITYEPIYLGEFYLTGYCPCARCCGPNAQGITSTGTVATEGRTIAVDPNIIPYGTHVFINGHEYIAEDCGGAIQENRIDIYKENHGDCFASDCNGYATVYIVK